MLKKSINSFILTVLLLGCAGSSAQADSRTMTYYQLQELVYNHTADYILIDVRTAAEYENGHIPSAILIPYDTIAADPPTTDKNALIILYCRTGRRSGIAYETLSKMGYKNLVNFGAVSNWRGELTISSTP
jgi:phage shock protein E